MDNKSYLEIPGWENTDGGMGRGCCSNNSSQWRSDDNSNNDKYTAAIELSNKCREFYNSRMEAANNMKSKWRGSCGTQQNNIANSDTSLSPSATSSVSSSHVNDNEKTNRGQQQRHRIDQAMEKLRTEMASLMDQDLSLMKQLLTLNETIEELKWQRQHYGYITSWASFSASKNLDSNFSVSDTEMYDSEDDFMATQHASCSSVQTGQVTMPIWHNARNVRKNSKDFHKISLDSVSMKVDSGNSALTNNSITATRTDFSPVYPEDSAHLSVPCPRFTSKAKGPVTIHHERGENSFDSGIHEVLSADELSWSS